MSQHPFKPGDKVIRLSRGDLCASLKLPYQTGDICEVVKTRTFANIPQIFTRGRWSGAKWWSLVAPRAKPMPSLLLTGVEELIKQITYKPGWSIEAHEEQGITDFRGRVYNGRVYVQLSVSAFAEASMDSVKRDGTRTPWKSAKRYLSPHMCRQELVGVVFGLIKDAELHEVHEWFRYKGASIFNPHLDPDVLAEVAKKKASFNVRENAMTMEEAA